MSDIPRKPARSRHPLVPENLAPTAQQTADTTPEPRDQAADPYADPMYDTPVNLQVRVPLRVRARLDELKKREGGSIAGHVSEGLSEWLTTKGV